MLKIHHVLNMHVRIIASILIFSLISSCRVYYKDPSSLNHAQEQKNWTKITTVHDEVFKCKQIEIKNDTIYGIKPGDYTDKLFKIPIQDIKTIQVENRSATIVSMGFFSLVVFFGLYAAGIAWLASKVN